MKKQTHAVVCVMLTVGYIWFKLHFATFVWSNSLFSYASSLGNGPKFDSNKLILCENWKNQMIPKTVTVNTL